MNQPWLAAADRQTELNIFRGQNERAQVGRLFGGQVLSQALMAAGRTVQRLPAHSLHGYFLRPGDPSVPVVYTVDRLRDGKSFVTRNVVAYQRGQAILNLSASFHQAEDIRASGPVRARPRACRRGAADFSIALA
jgi:acyl-CoA thioesterase-2